MSLVGAEFGVGAAVAALHALADHPAGVILVVRLIVLDSRRPIDTLGPFTTVVMGPVRSSLVLSAAALIGASAVSTPSCRRLKAPKRRAIYAYAQRHDTRTAGMPPTP